MANCVDPDQMDPFWAYDKHVLYFVVYIDWSKQLKSWAQLFKASLVVKLLNVLVSTISNAQVFLLKKSE